MQEGLPRTARGSLHSAGLEAPWGPGGGVRGASHPPGSPWFGSPFSVADSLRCNVHPISCAHSKCLIQRFFSRLAELSSCDHSRFQNRFIPSPRRRRPWPSLSRAPVYCLSIGRFMHMASSVVRCDWLPPLLFFVLFLRLTHNVTCISISFCFTAIMRNIICPLASWRQLGS